MTSSENTKPDNKKRIAIFVTSVYVVRFFLLPHLNALAKNYDVTLILNNDAPEILAGLDLPVRVLIIPIKRKISLIRDLKVLLKTIRLFRKEKFDLVHTMTPKAGLLGILAAFFARVPNRVHTFQGEVWASKTGFMRGFLILMDKLVNRLSTHITVVSHGERDFLISQKIIDEKKSKVIGHGSIGGVDLKRFKSDEEQRNQTRQRLGFKENDFVFLYVGRLNRDKGLLTLRDAFLNLSAQNPSSPVKLLIVGPDEENIREEYAETVPETHQRDIQIETYVDAPEIYMNAADCLVLPSFREGFGVVIIEAAAIGVPAIGSDIYGLRDAIVENETGLFFKVGNVDDLSDKMKMIAEDDNLRHCLSKNGQSRVREKFNQNDVIEEFLEFYRRDIFN